MQEPELRDHHGDCVMQYMRSWLMDIQIYSHGKKKVKHLKSVNFKTKKEKYNLILTRP